MRFVRIHMQLLTIQAQEHIGRKECDAFVPVAKGVIHDERFEKCGGHLGEIGIVTGSGAVQGAFQQP